jgi:hypothetical protein
MYKYISTLNDKIKREEVHLYYYDRQAPSSITKGFSFPLGEGGAWKKA